MYIDFHVYIAGSLGAHSHWKAPTSVEIMIAMLQNLHDINYQISIQSIPILQLL